MATTAIPANCAAVTNALLIESGRFGPGIYSRAARKRPIIRLMSGTRGAWLDGMGLSIGAVTFERSQPDTFGGVWANVALSDGDSVKANLTAAFADISQWVWGSRYTSEYVRLAGHHFTLSTTAGEQDDGVSWSSGINYNPSNLPTARPSQGLMNDIYMSLYREGADLASGIDESTAEPVFTAITSAENFRSIMRSDPTIATDNRYAFMGSKDDPNSPILPGMPTRRRNYGGFMYEIDPYPRKFTYSSGYHEVAPFVKSSTTKGNKWELNPAYKAAPYEEMIIFHQSNYQSLAVNTVTNPSPGWNFNPHDWMGKFEPRNILHETCNPDGTIIFWRSLFADASKPVNPAVGYSILFKACPANILLADCYGAYTIYGP